MHWKPITNGYSGSFPPGYKVRQARLQNVTKDPEASWQSLIDSGSTHAVVHPAAFAKPEDAATDRDLARGAQRVARRNVRRMAIFFTFFARNS